jgi:Peptidase family M23
VSGGIALVAAVAFALPSPSGTAKGAARAVLSVEASPASPRQGEIVSLLIRSDRPLAALRVAGNGQGLWLEPDRTGSLFRGLAGIDLDAAQGDRVLRLEGVETGGRNFFFACTLKVKSGRFAVEPLRVDPKYVEPPPEALARIRAEQEEVARVWAAADERRRWSGPFQTPVEASARNNFGARRVFNGERRSPHNGVDFAASAGTLVTAPGPGRVALADDLYLSGGTVILDHGGGLFTTYFHLSRINVKTGELVRTGQPVGAVGATGRATGPHLHWGARLNGARVNPIGLLRLPEWPLDSASAVP